MVFVAAGGIGIAHHVEPVAAPALTVAGRSQQAVDHLLKGFGGFVGEEILQLFFGGRQAGEVEGGAAQQGGFASWQRGCETVLFEVGQDELVDGVNGPILPFQGGGAACEIGLKDQKFLSASVITLPRNATGRTPVSANELPAALWQPGCGARRYPLADRGNRLLRGSLPCGGILIWFS